MDFVYSSFLIDDYKILLQPASLKTIKLFSFNILKIYKRRSRFVSKSLLVFLIRRFDSRSYHFQEN